MISDDGSLACLLNVIPTMYRACHVSKKMAEAFRNKNPHLANRFVCRSFEECYHQWSMSEEVIVAAFGSSNYIMKPYLEMLANHRRRLFLMFYKEGYCPSVYKSMHHYGYSLEVIKNIFCEYHCIEYQNYITVFS